MTCSEDEFKDVSNSGASAGRVSWSTAEEEKDGDRCDGELPRLRESKPSRLRGSNCDVKPDVADCGV